MVFQRYVCLIFRKDSLPVVDLDRLCDFHCFRVDLRVHVIGSLLVGLCYVFVEQLPVLVGKHAVNL